MTEIDLEKHISPHGRVTAVSMMKDEAPYLIEWFAHHLAVGFTDILVYTNDCVDGTDEMLIRLEELGLGHHRRNIIPDGVKPQPSAIKHAQNEPVVQESDWVLLFDADEFLCINYGDGTIDALISAAGDADGIVITWRIFGSGAVHDWSRAPVTEQYLCAAPPLWNKGWGVKTLFKFDADHWKLGIHRPKMKAKALKTDYPDSIHWLNGSGLPMEDYFKFRGWRSIRRTLGYDWAQMNHYAVKSIDAYAVRKFRGNVNLKKDKYNADYWALQDRNEVKDTNILRYSAQRARIANELLKDPVLNQLHHEALDRIEARLEEFKKTDAYAELKAGLIEASKIPITQITAKPPKARDPAKIAALMSTVEKRSTARPKSERRNPPIAGYDPNSPDASPYVQEPINRSSDVAIETVANHDILLPADPRIFGPIALEEVQSGKFDRRNARHRHLLIGHHDRLLELGAGICFLPVLAARENAKLVILAHEERADIAQVGREVAQTHDLDSDRIKIVDGPLFFSGDDRQASGLSALLADFKPNILVLNDPRITSDIIAAVPIQSVRRIVVTERILARHPFPGALENAGFAPSGIGKATGGLVLDRTSP